jgi:uncharacterized protein DUF6459
MPTRTRPLDRLARPGQDTLPAASSSGKPPDPAGPADAAGLADAAGMAGLAGTSGLAGVAEEPSWAGLRLVTVPDGWPPYDCEAHGAACPAAAPGPGETAMPTAEYTSAADAARPREGAGAAASGEGTGAAASGEATPREKIVTHGKAGPYGITESEPRGRAESRLAAAWPRQFGQVLVEVLAGFRPAKQLAPWATERVRAQVDLLSCAVSTEHRPRIRRVMTSRPTADVVEMTMVVGFGPTSRALAIRFEHIPARPRVPGRPARPARWLCTEIETS